MACGEGRGDVIKSYFNLPDSDLKTLEMYCTTEKEITESKLLCLEPTGLTSLLETISQASLKKEV